jgi:hypothetical protein
MAYTVAMADVLRSIPVVGVFTTLAGVTTLTDNHRNSVQGWTLTCAKGARTKLPSTEAANLYWNIELPSDLKASFDLRFDGSIPLADGVESPLNQLCRKLHSSKAK